MDAAINGVRYRLPLKTKNWQEARQREKEEVAAMAAGRSTHHGPMSRKPFEDALDAYLDFRKLCSAPRTCSTDKEKSRPLREFFGERGKNTQLRRITADHIVQYQVWRSGRGVSGRTINMEVGLLRRILKRHKQWVRLAEDVTRLAEQYRDIRTLSPEEKSRLLETAMSGPEWQVACCAARLALNPIMRGCELKGLRWKDVDLFDKLFYVSRQSTKTEAGARAIPLNRSSLLALSQLRSRARQIRSAEPDNYFFPACENGHIDPNKPMAGWRTAWRSLTRQAGLAGLRFHDLRHQAITELAEIGLSEQTIMSIAGHVSKRMLDHYSHIRLQAKRHALEALEDISQFASHRQDDAVPVTVQ